MRSHEHINWFDNQMVPSDQIKQLRYSLMFIDSINMNIIISTIAQWNLIDQQNVFMLWLQEEDNVDDDACLHNLFEDPSWEEMISLDGVSNQRNTKGCWLLASILNES